MDIIHDIHDKVTELDTAKKGKEPREASKRWRMEKENEMEVALEDINAQAIRRLDGPGPGQ